MRIAEAADVAAASMRALKEDIVRRARGRQDLETTIVCYRGSDPVAVITQPPHRDEMIRVSSIAAGGFGADILSVAHDTYAVLDGAPDPRTGKSPWRQGAMASYVQEYGFDGTVIECIMVEVHNRAGDKYSLRLPYDVDGRVVKWLPDPAGDDLENWVEIGILPEVFTQIMNSPTADQLVPQMGSGDPDRYARDVLTMELIEQSATLPTTVRLFAKPGTPRDQQFRKTLQRSQILNPVSWGSP